MSRKGDGKLPYRKGVGAVLFDARGRVFVARRIDTPGDAWQLPQGGIDGGEKPRRAVLRDLGEEIGTSNAEIIAKSAEWFRYDLPDHLVGKVWGGKYRGQKQRWFALRFLGTDADIKLDAHGHPEFDAWCWTEISTLPALAVPFKKPLYESLVAEFGSLAEAIASNSKV